MQCHSNLLLDCVSFIEYIMKCFGFFWEGEGRGKTIYSVAEIDIHFMTQMILKKTIQFFHNKLPQIKKLMQL